MLYAIKKDIIEIAFIITIIIFSVIPNLVPKSASQNSYTNLENINVSQENILNSNINSNKNLNKILNTEVTNTNQLTSVEENRDNTKMNVNNSWRIEIPKIGLNAPIKEGTTQQVMLEAVGHFTETSKDTGNVGLAAHNRGYQCNFFSRIKELKKGDKIIYRGPNKTRTYIVEINTIIEQTNWDYLKESKDNRITLITCEENKREYRRCIQAIEEKS